MKGISITNLSKTFTGKRMSKVTALDNVSFDIDQGEVFGFLGPNGAGKSTTIKCLMGLIRPTAGLATIMGEPAGTLQSRLRVGFLPENPAFYDYLTADEYLRFVGSTFSMPKTLLEDEIKRVLQQLELWDARNRAIRSYSKGMVQRVGLAQVLLHDPDIYILDEPMSGLDPLGRAMVKEIMLDLKSRGKTVFFSTHITADVESVCDRVGIILKGELKSVERIDRIMAEGLLGYNLRTKLPDESATTDRYVAKNDLQAVMQEILNSGAEISLIEPCRKSLEEFFLDIIKGAA